LTDGVAFLLSSQSRPLLDQSHTAAKIKAQPFMPKTLCIRAQSATSLTVPTADLVVLTDGLLRAFGANTDFS
jgi:hypothetical protein